MLKLGPVDTKIVVRSLQQLDRVLEERTRGAARTVVSARVAGWAETRHRGPGAVLAFSVGNGKYEVLRFPPGEKTRALLAEFRRKVEALPDDTEAGEGPLSDEEEALLQEGGLDPEAPADGLDPVAEGQRAYQELLRTALTTQEAAALLGVHESRIRQRLNASPPTLYGVRCGHSWRLPRFQFRGNALVPGIERVLAAVPSDLSPLTLERWFNTPNPDLAGSSERVLSPLEWLGLGNPPGNAVELVANL